MAKYIDVKKIPYHLVDSDVKAKGRRVAYKNEIDKMPAADVRPERHGEWRNWGRDWKCCQHFQCSECKKEVVRCIDSKAQFQYCPYCGAKMDGKDG